VTAASKQPSLVERMAEREAEERALEAEKVGVCKWRKLQTQTRTKESYYLSTSPCLSLIFKEQEVRSFRACPYCLNKIEIVQ